MLDELVSTIDAVVRQNGNTCSVTCDESVGAMHADLTKTRQILFNLLSNAAKFTKDGADRPGRREATDGGEDS